MSEGSADTTPLGPRAHDTGAHGTVVVSGEADDVRIRGVDGTAARIVAPVEGEGIETEAADGRFTVRSRRSTRAGWVGLKVGSHGFGFPFGGPARTLEMEVPRGSRVEVHVTAGDVAVRDVSGGTRVRTTSGDVSLKRVAGSLAVEVASGDVNVTAAAPIELTAKSVSGDIQARAPRFERVAIETISGDADLSGAFAAGPVHAISTVAGDVTLGVAGGLTLEARTVSGDVECSHPDRRSGDGRRRPLVVGDGSARLAVRTMSGDVDVRAARGAATADEGESAAAWPSAAPEDAAPAPPAAPPPGEPSLDVLEALARGEIDVAEAERRLAAGAGADRADG